MVRVSPEIAYEIQYAGKQPADDGADTNFFAGSDAACEPRTASARLAILHSDVAERTRKIARVAGQVLSSQIHPRGRNDSGAGASNLN